MKKIIRTLLVSLVAFICVYSVANAYEVKQGDTMWKISQNAGISLVQLIRNNPQVSNPDLIFPGQQINTGGSLLGATQRPSGYQTTLSQSLSETASTTEDIKVVSLTTKDGHTLTTADVGNYIILTISPGKGNEEKVLCVGGTATSTRKWLTCTRGFNYYNQTYGTATVYPHSPGEIVIISDDDAYNATVYGYLSANNTWTGTNTSTGAWIFSNTNGMCLYNTNFCLRSNGTNIQWTENGWTDSYNFTSSSITQLTASSTAGIGVTDSKIYVNASSTKGLAFDANGALYQKVSSTQGLQSDSNGIGIDYSNNNTWTGTNTFNGTTTLATTTFSSVNSLLVTGGLSILQNTFTASEYITKGQAVIIGDNTTSTGDGNIASSPSTAYTMNTTTWLSHYFTTSDRAIFIKEVSIYSAGVSTSRTLTISIRSADGSYKPIGSDIGGITATTTIGTSAGWNKVVFSNPVPVNPSSNYAIVARSSGESNWNTNNVTSGGDRNASSTDSGVTWFNYSSGSQRLMFLIAENQSVNGQISRADASINNSLANNFIGFAAEDIATSTSGLVTINGIDNNQSGLTVGSIYYLSDTSGAISSTAGTISRKIGLAVSSTQLLIKHDNP